MHGAQPADADANVALCQTLTAQSATDPLLAEYVRVRTRTADWWLWHGEQTMAPDLMHQVIPGLGKAAPYDAIQRAWRDVLK